MNDAHGYVVFFFPQALEVLGEPFRHYLLGAPGAEHVLCREIDTGGAFISMMIDGQTKDGRPVQIQLMVPSSMVRMVVSAQGDEAFGFRPRAGIGIAAPPALPPVGPTAASPQSPTQAVPMPIDAPTETPSKP